MSWTPDERHRKQFGPYSMVPLRGPGGTGYEITGLDAGTIRVLPDADTSGQKRSRIVSEALTALHAIYCAQVDGVDVLSLTDDDERPIVNELAVLAGLHNLTWMFLGERAQTFEEWFDEAHQAGWTNAKQFITEAADAGWEIRRKDDR